MKAIEKLESMGYLFWVKNNNVHYIHIGPAPDPEQVRPLLTEIKALKAEAVNWLQQRPFTSKTKKRVIFPADSALAFPAGTWQRMEDGRIEALLCYEDMKDMLYWRDVVFADQSN